VGSGGSLAGAVLGGWLLRQHGSGRLAFDRLGDVGRLTFAAVAAAVPSAAAGLLTLMANRLPANVAGRGALSWWLGDVAGVLLIAPILLGADWRAMSRASSNRRSLDIATWTALVVSAAVAVWFTIAPGVLRFPATTACLPMLAIAAVRFGPRGAALANVFTAAIVVGIVFVANRPEFNVVLVAFLAVSSVTALSLGAVTAERDFALSRLAADLDARIAAESARRAAETERHLAQAAHEADRKRFAALLEHSHDAIAVVAPDGRIAFVTDAIARFTGREPAELSGHPAFEHVHPDDLASVQASFNQCLQHPGVTTRAEFRISTASNSWVWLEAIGVNHLASPSVAGVVVNIRDVTERRETEDRLRNARELLEATGRLARIGGWEYSIADDRLVWSDQTYRIHGVTPGQYTPTVEDAFNFYVPEARPLIRAALERGISDGESWNLILPFITDTGRKLWVNAIGHLETRDGKPRRLYGTFQDVTERVESERAIRQSESRYQNLFESAPVAIWEEDLTAVAEWFDSLRASGVTELATHLTTNPGLLAVTVRMIRVRDVNEAGIQMHRAGSKDELLQNLDRVFTPETLSAVREILLALWSGHSTVRVECRVGRLDGTHAEQIIHLRVPAGDGKAGFSRAVAIALDVTEQKRLEEQFRQSQKLEAVGRLAGGIAHDFNNLLTVINGFAELILADSPPGTGPHDLASHIRDAGGRAAELTRQLLAFSRKHPAAAGPIDLTEVVGNLAPLLAPLVGSPIRLVTRLDPVPPIRADKGQFEQVVMNLVVNARDAMPSGGTLTITTQTVEIDPHDGSDVPSGRWVVLSVADTGTGIRDEDRPHLFEPFFTTKELGRGTGLGLSTVYGIVTTARGHLRYETGPGQGTTFRIYLPGMPDSREKGTNTAPRVNKPSRGEENGRSSASDRLPAGVALHVLLVEDLPAVRTLTAQILSGAGYRVTDAEDGEMALHKLAAMPQPPDVLVTDMQMPGMDGRELARKVRYARPDLPVLFISGFAPEAVAFHAPGAREGFLPKPFSPEELIQALLALMKA